ncbi:MAG: c-type cytochrome [Anaerolineae bacterium]|nr:c-type cytochrome [Anaerolineae bacterium]
MSQQKPQRNDDQSIIAVAVLFGIIIVVLFLVFLNQPVPQIAPTPTPTVVVVEPTPEATPESTPPPTGGQTASYTAEQVAAGQRIYGGLCFACHAQGGVGITGLGKPLVNSEFVDGLTDAELVAFLEVGRQPTDPLNTTGQLMPARGGNPALTEEDLYNVTAYLRSLNGAPVSGGAATPAPDPNVTPTAQRVPSDASNWTPPVLGGGAEATTDPAAQPEATAEPAADEGARLYAWSCAACHGAAGEGVDGQAVLVGAELDWDAFVTEITTPSAVTPASTVFAHPYRGGVPELTDEQIAAIVAFTQGLGS